MWGQATMCSLVALSLPGQIPKESFYARLDRRCPSTHVLADPILELHKPDGTVTTNDNWRETQEQEIIDTTLAPTNDLESAIVATLDPGTYTAIVRGQDGGIGVALVRSVPT